MGFDSWACIHLEHKDAKNKLVRSDSHAYASCKLIPNKNRTCSRNMSRRFTLLILHQSALKSRKVGKHWLHYKGPGGLAKSCGMQALLWLVLLQKSQLLADGN